MYTDENLLFTIFWKLCHKTEIMFDTCAVKPTCLKMETSPLEVSPDGELAIHSSHDGVIKVWETVTSSLRNEYKPSSHLSTTCSCLSWCQRSRSSVSYGLGGGWLHHNCIAASFAILILGPLNSWIIWIFILKYLSAVVMLARQKV